MDYMQEWNASYDQLVNMLGSEELANDMLDLLPHGDPSKPRDLLAVLTLLQDNGWSMDPLA